MGLFFTSLIGTVLAFFAKDLVLRGVKKGVYIAGFLAATYAFFTVISNLTVGLAESLPGDLVDFATSVLPRNLDECTSLLVTARIARYVYDVQDKIAEKVTN